MEIASFTDPCEEHFHISMPSSLPLKAVKGGVRILRGTRRLMRSPLCVKMDQWNKTRKLLAEPRRTPGWGDSWVGQWDRRWVGVNSKSESVVVVLSLSPPSLPTPTSSLISVDRNRLGDVCSLMGPFFFFFFFFFPFFLKKNPKICPTPKD